jgi:hypothetical protein
VSAPVFLIACSKAKADRSCRARDLYRGDLFRKSVAYAEAEGARWYILSARYGLLHPDAFADPYELTLAELTQLERLQWGERVAHKLPTAPLVFLAGKLYREAVLASPHMNHTRASCTAPLAGLGIGQQKRRLLELVRCRGCGEAGCTGTCGEPRGGFTL